MRYHFNFKKMAVSEALENYAKEKVSQKIQKLVTKPTQALLTFEVDHLVHRTDLQLQAGDGFAMHLHAEAADMYAAVDALVHKLFHQLKKQKEKIKNHKGNSSVIEVVTAPNEEAEAEIDADDILAYEAIARQKRNRA